MPTFELIKKKPDWLDVMAKLLYLNIPGAINYE
jgi:hypothetical protein